MTATPLHPPHHTILSLDVESGSHFPALHVDFAAGLSCIIGGRGAGKSALLQHVRFALGHVGSPTRAEATRAHLEANLGVGRATVTIRTRHGQIFTSSRSVGEEPCVRDEAGNVVAVSLAGELFELEAYGQREIEGIALHAEAQLALIDKFAEADIRRSTDAIAHIQRRLALNAAELTRLNAEIREAEDQIGELPAIVTTLASLDPTAGADAEEEKRAHAAKVNRGRERAAIDALAKDLGAVAASLTSTLGDAQRRLSSPLAPDLEQGPNGPVLTGAYARSHALASRLAQLQTRVLAEITSATTALAVDQRALAVSHANDDDAYKTLTLRVAEDRGRLSERNRLQRRFVELDTIAKHEAELRAEHATRLEERRQMRLDLAREYEARFASRAAIVEELNAALDGDIRVSVKRAAGTGAYATFLKSLLQGANIRPQEFVGEIARHIRPDDLAACAWANDTRPLVALDDSKSAKVARAQRIIDALVASGRLFELETLALDDVPLIELRVNAQYKPSSRVSEGQRCTCILSILFLQSASPLLIDQPEDELDNAFVFEMVVKKIARAKMTRQLIFATHNPNIPLLGDADRVIVLEADAETGRVAAAGTVDEARELLVRLLEGGRVPFALRGKRYGEEPEVTE